MPSYLLQPPIAALITIIDMGTYFGGVDPDWVGVFSISDKRLVPLTQSVSTPPNYFVTAGHMRPATFIVYRLMNTERYIGTDT